MWKLLITLLVFITEVIYANDSAGTTAAGGIQFIKTPSICMEKEQLTLSLNQVKVDYLFKNKTDRPVKLAIYFPLPPYHVFNANTSWDTEVGISKESPFTNFSVVVDGQSRVFNTTTRALLKGEDITQLLISSGIPLNPSYASGKIPMNENDAKRFNTWNTKAKALGLLNTKGEPRWEKQVIYSWEETFPPQKLVHITHNYRPSQGNFFEVADKNSEAVAIKNISQRMQQLFNVDLEKMVDRPQFNAWITKHREMEHKDTYAYFRNINYILSTGKNWSGPIQDFELILLYPKEGAVIYNPFYSEETKTQIIKKPGELHILLKDFTPQKDLQVVFATTAGLTVD